MKNEKPDLASLIKWTALLKAIKDEKCVLCIGPGVFTNEAGLPLEDQIVAQLKGDGEIDEDVVVYPDGLFHFRKKNKRDHVLADLEKFYSGPFPEAEGIFKKLIQIPFNLVVILTPDNKFHEIAHQEHRPYLKDLYRKGKPPTIVEKPTKESPLVFHLLGALNAEADESVVLTHDDLFAFLKNIFEGGPISEELNSTIHSAKHFICLGLPFEKWYMQLLLRVLGLHANENSTKYVSHQDKETEVIEIYKDQFNLTLIPTRIEHFANILLEKCIEDHLLRPESLEKTTENVERDAKEVSIDLILQQIADDQIEDAFGSIELILKQKEKWDSTRNTFVEHQGQYQMLKRQLDKNFISSELFNRGIAKLRSAILDFIKLNLYN